MTYHAGIGFGMQALGLTPCEPHVTCDGCGAVASCYTKRGDVAAWIRKGKHPPRWAGTRVECEDGTIARTDYCPKCRAALAAGSGEGEKR